MGAQFHWLPAFHAADHSRPGLSAHAAGGREARYAHDSRHDRARPSSGRNPKVEAENEDQTHALESEAAARLEKKARACWPRHGLEARQDVWRRQQGPAIAA